MTPARTEGVGAVGEVFTVCPASSAPAVKRLMPGLRYDFTHMGSTFFRGEPPLNSPGSLNRQFLYRRLLDRFHLIYPAADADATHALEVALFDYLAGDYDHAVNISNNLHTVRVLLELVDMDGTVQPILDFGCGPAVSQAVAEDLGISLVGYDPSPRMRKAAEFRGMRVLTTDELVVCEEPFAGIIASYVLHLTIVPNELLAAVECLAPGARFAANFHKGINVLEVESLIASNGGCVQLSLTDHPHLRGHGEIRLWERTP
jgi:hypothetical protein